MSPCMTLLPSPLTETSRRLLEKNDEHSMKVYKKMTFIAKV